jgi:DNA repair protein RadA/Sms
VPRTAILDPIDLVLGGSDASDNVLPGVASATVVQISGDPGAGKSTLLIQACGEVAKRGPVLYASREESAASIGARARRVGIGIDASPVSENLLTVDPANIEEFWDLIRRIRPILAVYDSEQVARSRTIDASPRSNRMIAYVAEGTFDLVHALGGDTVAFLICQVNKEGDAAGPKAGEHFVDATLHLDKLAPGLRCLSTSKNRNGPETRQAMLAMTARGLVSSDDMEAQAHAHTPEAR